MHIIDKDGNIIEGQPLSTEEHEILTELSSGAINAASSGTYIPEREERRIARMLIENYHLTRREPLQEDAPAPPPPFTFVEAEVEEVPLG